MMVGERGPGHGGFVYCEVEGVASEVSAENLRLEGLFVPTPEPRPIDEEVDLFLRSEAGEIELRGLVVQVIGCVEAAAQRRSPGYGVLFLDLKESQRAWIARTRHACELRQESRAPAEPHPAPTPRRSTSRGARARASARTTPVPIAPAAGTQRVDDAIERARAARKAGTTAVRTSARAQLEAQLAALKARSPSDILGVSSPQDVEAAHRAFLALSKRFHPHVYARHDSAEITRLATEIFIVYKRAYAAIRSASKDGGRSRSAADIARVTSAAPPAPAPAASSVRPANAAATQGSTPVSSMRPVAPAATRGSISSLHPTAASSARTGAPRASLPASADPARRIADAELLLAGAVRHVAAARFEQAELDLAKAAALAPERVDIAVWRFVSRARAHKAHGRVEDARSCYRKVLELDPQHREAREQAEPAERRRGGLVSKWLGGDDE